MYQNESFYMNAPDKKHCFNPVITSAFRILADNSYYHLCDDDEKNNHHNNTIAFIRCTDGEGRIYLKNTALTLKENECVFLNFHDIVKYKCSSNIWGYRWINFTAENADNEFELNKIYAVPFSENEDKAFQKLLYYGQAQSKNQGYINALFESYFYCVMLENQLDNEKMLLQYQTRLIDELCSFIQQKVYSKISVEDVAAFFKLSSRRVHQIFTKELGISPKKYILKKKMEEGYKLLVQTSTPINKIADMLCFSSAYHFTNEFKKTFKQSPSAVRNMK